MSAEAKGGAGSSDPFDRIYSLWAEQAMGQRKGIPSRERWDAIVLRLILSEDPDRVRRYRNLEATGPGTLGADAYELWSKMPSYTPNLTVPLGSRPDFHAYEEAQRGSMKRLMGGQGLLDKYNEMVSEASRLQEPKELSEADKARAKRAQASVFMIGCAGMAAIAFMLLTVLLIIALRMM